MAKATTIKEAIKRFEDSKSCVAAEEAKVRSKANFSTRGLAGAQPRLSWEESRCLKCSSAAPKLEVVLLGQCPPIEKMDATLSTLKSCVHLALSTNNIEKISSLTGMENLKVLSLGRNCIKKIENLDGIADTLEELWLSYNLVEKLAGIEKLSNVRVLYLGNNKIKDWAEVERLASLEKLEDLLLKGCPIFEDASAAGNYRVEVLKRVPQLKKLDGVPIDVDEREAAAAAAA